MWIVSFQLSRPGQKERKQKGYVMSDHMHMLISIPPKYRDSDIVGDLKEKAQFIWRDIFEEKRGTLREKAFGRVVTLFLQ